MEAFKKVFQELLEVSRNNRRFDADQRVALRMFALALRRASCASDLDAEFEELKKIVGRRTYLFEQAEVDLMHSVWRHFGIARTSLQSRISDAINGYDCVLAGA